MVWQAARRELTIAIVLQVVGGLGVVVQVLVGRAVLEAILDADRLDRDPSTVVPSLVALAVVTAVVNFAGAFRNQLQALLTELTSRHAQGRILDVASVVSLAAFEDPEFHDRLQRAQTGANSRPWIMTSNLVTLVGAVIGVAGLVVALAALEPILLPLVVVAYVPAWLAASSNSRASYRFGWGMTPNDASGTPSASSCRASRTRPRFGRSSWPSSSGTSTTTSTRSG